MYAAWSSSSAVSGVYTGPAWGVVGSGKTGVCCYNDKDYRNCIFFSIFAGYNFNPSYKYLTRQKGGDLTQSYDKSPYTNRNAKRAK